MTEQFDAVIVGSGQAGNPLAAALARAGKRTAVIEGKHVGGTCINEGCTPTKTMVASGRVAYLAKRGADYGVLAGQSISTDMQRVRARKRQVVDVFRSGTEKRLTTTNNIELIKGWGRFTGQKTIEIALNEGGTRTLQAEWVFINTGLRSAVPEIHGLSELLRNPLVLNNESIMELDAVPKHLVILGGGYIGIEFGQMFRRFGSKVTIVHNSGQLLEHEDVDISDEVKKILVEDGIEILFHATTESVRAVSASTLELQVEVGAGSRTLDASHLLLATGRAPNSDALNLSASGVAVDGHGYIKVDEWLETSTPGIYGLGDIKGGPAFTHISYDDYRVVKTNLLDGGKRSIRDRILPYTVFMDPQLGRIGLTETEARKQGRKIRIAKMTMDYVARAYEMAETRGFMKVIVDAETELILGAAVLGIEGGETASAIQLAMMGGLKYTALRDGIFSHPTLAESLNNIFMHWEGES